MGQVEGIKMKLETKDYKVKATYLFYWFWSLIYRRLHFIKDWTAFYGGNVLAHLFVRLVRIYKHYALIVVVRLAYYGCYFPLF